jgi:phage host-nuclease inhibitor protein Gam
MPPKGKKDKAMKVDKVTKLQQQNLSQDNSPASDASDWDSVFNFSSVNSELDKINTELGSSGEQPQLHLNKAIQVIITSLQDLTKTFKENFAHLVEELKSIKTDLTGQVRELSNSVEVLKNNNEEKDKVINALVLQVNDLEQYGRNRNIELINVEETEGEVIEDILSNLAGALGVDLVQSDIEAAHRLPSRKADRAPRIIVQFLSRKKREEFLRNKRTVVTSNRLTGVNSQDGQKKVFINENLTSFYRDLLWRAKTRAKEVGFKFVWCRRGKIFARKDEATSVLKINSLQDLDKISN